jgi:hypothetical protein
MNYNFFRGIKFRMRAAAVFAAGIFLITLLGDPSQSADQRKIIGNWELRVERDRFTDTNEIYAITGTGDRAMLVRCGESGLDLLLIDVAGKIYPTATRFDVSIRIDRNEVSTRPGRLRSDGAVRIWLGPSLLIEMNRGREIAFRFDGAGGDWVFALAGAAQALKPVSDACKLK